MRDQAQDERTIVSPKSLYSGKNNLKIKDYDGQVWKNEKGEEWLQANDDDASYGSAPKYQIDLREAMRVSANSAFVQLGMDVGLDKVKEAAVDAGLKESSLAGTSFPSFSIGISDPSAIRMAGAYATFAASGKQNDPFSVEDGRDEGRTRFRPRRQRRAQAGLHVEGRRQRHRRPQDRRRRGNRYVGPADRP